MLLFFLLFSRFFGLRLRLGLGKKELHRRDGDKYQEKRQHKALLSARIVLGIVIFGQVMVSINFFWAQGHSHRAPEGCNEVSAIQQEQLHELLRDGPRLLPRTQNKWARTGRRQGEEAKSAACTASAAGRLSFPLLSLASLNRGKKLLNLRVKPGKFQGEHRFTRVQYDVQRPGQL